MKKLLIFVFVLFLVFCGYIVYDTKFKDEINVLDIEEDRIEIDSIYIYGTHLNIHGKILDGDGFDLVLYNGEFKSVDINIFDGEFNLSNYVNDGLYLDDIERGKYYLFLRKKTVLEDDKVEYKYYAIDNKSEYPETTYYTFSNFNNKIVINSEDSYPTMLMTVDKNVNNDVFDVVIDPGHGGMDGGASRYGYSESDFTMKIALGVKEKLEEYGFKVKLTREENQLTNNETLNEYGLHGRAVVPYEVKAKYLFSCHINSNNSSLVNGLEVYTATGINYDLANSLVKNITSNAGIGYSNNRINKINDSIYTRNFTDEDINDSLEQYKNKNLIAYDISTKSNYYYIIRETGGIITGAYVDDRNSEILGNPYTKSNVGTEAYLLELGYISNKNDLDKLVNNLDGYILGIANGIKDLYIPVNTTEEK